MQTCQQSLLQIFKNNALEAITFLICEFCFMNSVVFKKKQKHQNPTMPFVKTAKQMFHSIFRKKKQSSLFKREEK